MFFTLTINFRSYFYAFTYFSSCRRNQPPALKQPSWGLQYFRVKFSEKIVWSWSEHFFIHKLLENSRICRENHHCENNHCATTTLCSCSGNSLKITIGSIKTQQFKFYKGECDFVDTLGQTTTNQPTCPG